MSNSSTNAINQNLDLKEVLSKYTKHWKWFLLSVILGFSLAYVYLRYATPEYEAVAKIQILEDKQSGGFDVFQDLNLFSGSKNKVEDEIQIINSRSNFMEVVKALDLNIQMYVMGNVINSELYQNPPIKLNFIAVDSVINKANFDLYLSLSSNTTFGYSLEEDAPMAASAFGKRLETPIGDVVITPNLESFERYLDKKIKVSITPVDMVANDYNFKTIIVPSEQYSNILNISLQDPVKEKARDILAHLIRVYNQNAITDKQEIADKTSDFINNRITEIYSNLANVDDSEESLRTTRGLTDIASQSNVNINIGAANQQELANYQTQLNIAASMKDILDQQEGFDVLPANIGLSDGTIANTTERYNQIVQERNRLLKSSNDKNPVIVNLNQQLQSLKQTMQASLGSTVNNLGMQVNNLSGQQAIINSRIYSAPKNERALRDITRKQQTTESLYLYLLQKREEAQIGVASTAPKSKIIDDAYIPSPIPVSPKRKIVFLASILLGLLIPFSLIYVSDLLDDKVHNMHSLEKITKDTPVLGEIPRLTKKDSKFIAKEDRSVLSESLRIIRTNLDYLIKTKRLSSSDKNNVVFVTSSVPGEGKTFLSSNLAMILASTDKKVLLIGADIRNPKLYTFFSGENVNQLKSTNRNKDAGLTEYLFDYTLTIKDLIHPMLVHSNTIDVIYSGRIPPNPAELLLSDRVKGLFEQTSLLYDYVIVDTAPMMVVTDTLLISEYANHLIYVTRADVTETKAVEFPLKLKEEQKIRGLAFVVNDVNAANLGYGGKYGYGYGKTLKKWWKF